MAQDKKPAPDWERIEVDYRAGIKSVREIAAEHGISEGAIRKRSKRDDWSRDLSKRIQDKAEALVRTEEVRTKVRTESVPSDREIVEVNAQAVANVRLTHRQDIARARKLVMSLLGEMEAHTDHTELFEQLADLLHSDDTSASDKRFELFNRVLTLPSRVDSMKKLAETLKNLVALEREAYGLKPDEPDDESKKTVVVITGGLPDESD